MLPIVKDLLHTSSKWLFPEYFISLECMGNIFNRDFQDFIQALNQASVRYVLVGGYAVILHGYNRTTGDLDIWVDRTESNFQKLSIAFASFGMPLFDIR